MGDKMKLNRKGFMLAEVVVSASVVAVVLVTMYIGINRMTAAYDKRNRYYDLDAQQVAMEVNDALVRNMNFDSLFDIIGGDYILLSEENEEFKSDVPTLCTLYKEKLEITIEVNPGTVTKEKLQMFKNCGINRLSIGLQSTNDELLKQLGRIHNYNQFLDTYNWAKEVGFENINVDLMLGIPNQKIEDLKDSLEKIVNLKPKHISVYSLIVEEATPIEKMINSGELKLPEEEEERNEYHYTKNYLELNGYKHYEISNFAIDGYESKHNTNCWKQKSYIGFGIAAHSYMNGVRYSNTTDLKQYLIKSSKEIKTIHEKQKKEDMQKEYMMLGLRMLDGVKISEFKAKFGENPIFLFRKELEKLVNEELVEIDLDNIKLTNKGLDLANLVWEEFV